MNSAKYAEQEAYDRERARIWLQDLLGLDVQSDFFSELADGVLLCSIVNTIKPGTIKKVNSASKSKKLVAKRLENLNAFLFGCKRIGVYPSYQFEIQEFQERKREDKLIRCLLKLEEIARKAGIDPSKHGEIHIGSDEPGAPPSPTPSRTPASPSASASASAAPPSPTVSPAKDQDAEERERKEKERRAREEKEREERERAEREKEERERAEREREEREREEKERLEREREEKEREERERREQERLEREAEEARLQREKEESERRAREEREERERREAEEREEKERRAREEREERERKEKQQQEVEEKKAERERKEAEEKSAREAKLRTDREARENKLREEREKREAEEKERREKEEKAKKEREEKLRRDREQREKERKEREEKEKQEKEKKAAEAGAGGLKSKFDLFGGAALKPPASRPSGPPSPKISSPSSPSTTAEGGNPRAFFSQMAGEPAKATGGGKITLAPGKKLTGTDALLYWSQTNTAGYAGVDIRDFTESWRDGLGFCALVHAHFPSEIDFNSCVSKTPSERLELAFDAAGRMGVPPLLDPEDITDVKSVDARSLITYLGCLYKGFKR